MRDLTRTRERAKLEFVAECCARARSADLSRPGTFADAALRAAAGATLVADATCGARPDLGVRWRALGHSGPLVFIDWHDTTWHRAAYRACLDELGTPDAGRARWACANVHDLDLDDAWLAIHATLPRWPGAGGGVRMPRGCRDGVAVLRDLSDTGAAGLSALLAPLELNTVLDGARALGWPVRIEPGIRSADFESRGFGPCIHVQLGLVG